MAAVGPLRPGDGRPAVPGGRLGDRQRADVRQAHPDERGRERHGERRRRAGPALEDSRHPARRAPHQERRHHRRASRQGHRQVRQARRRDRGTAARDQPARHDGQHGDQRDQVQGCRHLLAASAEQEDRARDRAGASRRPEEAGRARGSDPVPRETEHPARAGADGHLRPDDRDRRYRDGEGGVQLGQAGLRRRRRQRDGRRRRNRRPRRRRDEHADQQDAEPRVRLLVRRQPAGRGDRVRRVSRAAAEGRRLPRAP